MFKEPVMKYVFHSICVMMVWGCFSITSPEVYAKTEVSGIISENKVWSAAGSPYIVTGNIRVIENVTLTIEKSVIVQFRPGPISSQGYYLQVDGALVVQGEANAPILFTTEEKGRYWGCIAFTDRSLDWDASASSGSVIKNAIIEYAGNSQGKAHRYGGAAINCFSARPLISDNIIRYSAGNGLSVSSDSASETPSSGIQAIYNNRIHHTTTGISLTVDGCRIENNYFLSNTRAISFGLNLNQIEIVSNTLIDTLAKTTGSLIHGSFYFLVDDNAQTLDTASPPTPVSIRGNLLKSDIAEASAATEPVLMAFTEYDFTGVNQDSAYGFTLIGNTIEADEGAVWVYLYNWRHTGADPINMTGNYWGTSSESEIKAGLYDAANDFNLPAINYGSYLNSPVPDGGATTSYPPVSNAGSDMQVSGGVTVTLDGTGSYDPDKTMTYLWTQTEGPPVTLTPVEGEPKKATFVSPYSYTDNTLVFTLTVTDKNGFYDMDEVTILVNESIANAGQDRIVQGKTLVNLDASNTYDPDNTMAYQWKQLSGPAVELIDPDKKNASFTAPYVDVENELLFQLTVTDENGFSATDEITVLINENIANAGLDRAVYGDERVFLDGSNSYDPERLMTYKWTQVGGPPVTLDIGDDAIKASFIAPYVDEDNSLLTFKLTVSNSNGFESTDEVAISLAAPVTIDRENGACFIGTSLSSDHQNFAWLGRTVFSFLGAGMLIFIFMGMVEKGALKSVRNLGIGRSLFLLVSILISFLSPGAVQAGYFSIGNGGGGEADAYNLTIETGAVRLGGGNPVYLLGGGVFGMFHGYDDYPANTRDYACPHGEFTRVDKIIEGVESGLYGKTGVNLFDTDLYLSVLAGLSMVTEVQLVQSNLTQLYYEQTSEQKFYGIYGGGIGYFPDRFRWEFAIQIDYDNRRGVVGSVGFHW